MDRFDLREEIGDGAFGCVFRGIRKTTREEFAIKKIKGNFNNWKECNMNRELRALVDMANKSEFIVQTFECIRETDGTLYFVYELMPDGSLYDYLKRMRQNRIEVDRNVVRCTMSQILQGIGHIHGRGYIHRDLKPENLLLRGNQCKIADFSLSRKVLLEARNSMTSYVATRWYRPPEIILCDPKYGAPVDIFSVGSIMAEMFRFQPLFAGENEIHQLHSICEVLGPLEQAWPEAQNLCKRRNIDTSSLPPKEDERYDPPMIRLAKQVPRADDVALPLMLSLLNLNPRLRPTAEGALAHKYFRESAHAHRSMERSAKRFPFSAFEGNFRKTDEATRRDFYSSTLQPDVVTPDIDNDMMIGNSEGFIPQHDNMGLDPSVNTQDFTPVLDEMGMNVQRDNEDLREPFEDMGSHVHEGNLSLRKHFQDYEYLDHVSYRESNDVRPRGHQEQRPCDAFL